MAEPTPDTTTHQTRLLNIQISLSKPFPNSSANRRHEWYSHDDYRYHLNRFTTYSQAASDMPGSYPAIWFVAPAAPCRPEWQVKKEGGPCSS